jgi:hypothetical protein
MPESTPTPAPEMGIIARAMGILTAPGRTFEVVVANPRPAAILLLVTLVMAIAASAPQFTEKGRLATLEMQVQTIERMTGQPISDQMYQQMATGAQSTRGGYYAMISTFIFMPIVALFFTALYWAVFNAVLGGTASFKQVLGVITQDYDRLRHTFQQRAGDDRSALAVRH